MIPYLAVIKDSFRAASQSMMLRTLFVVVTILLLLILPFGYTETLTGHVRWQEIPNWREKMDEIYAAKEAGQPSPEKHIWSMLSDPLQKEAGAVYGKLQEELEAIAAAAEAGEEPPQWDRAEVARFNQRINNMCMLLHKELDDNLLEDPDFYDAAAWEGKTFNEELQERLNENPSAMSEYDLRRRNRLLLEAAEFVPRSPPVSVKPTYFGRVIPGTTGNTKDAAIEWYRGYIGWLMDWPVSMALVFIAIIATSGIMPNMFEPGSISLLLSKPITRSRLFLSQFAGACIFMLLAAVYFTLGVWLIAAIRLGIYNPTVFWCIPLFTFMFMVYYTVSAYVGLVTRSAIKAVIATILMFYLCFFVGLAKVSYDDWNVDAARLVHVIDTGDTVIASDDPIFGAVKHYSYDENSREWKDIFQQQGFSMGEAERAIYDRPHDRLLAIEETFQGSSLALGPARDSWARELGTPVPEKSIELLVESDDSVLAISREGIYRLTGDATNKQLVPDLPLDQPLDDFLPEEEAGNVNEDMPLDGTESEKATGESTSADETNSEESEDIDDEPADGESTADEADEEAGEGSAESDPGTENGEEGTAAAETDTEADGNNEQDSGADSTDTDDGEAAEPKIDRDDGSSEENATTEDEGDKAIADAELQQQVIDVINLDRFGAFERVGPAPPKDPPMSVAIGPSNDRLFFYANGLMAVYDKGDDGRYTETVRDDLPDSQEKAAALAVGSSSLLVARDDGKVFILNPETLNVEQEFNPENEVPVRFTATSDNGRWVAMLFPNRKVWLYDMLEKKLTKPNIWTQGDISAVGFSENRLLIIDRIARVREFELPDLTETRTLSPSRIPYLSETVQILPGVEGNWYIFHRWVITPLYTVLPKPGELGWAMNYLATGEQTDKGLFVKILGSFGINFSRGEGTDANREYVRNPWRGVRSCSIFIAVMLVLSCWQISRTEF